MSDSEPNSGDAASGTADTRPSSITEITLDGSLLSQSFRQQSAQITDDIIRYICGEVTPAPCKSATIMRNLVDDLLQTRLSSMRQLAERLDVQQPDDVALLDNVATAMFDDDVVTWGRIVTLFAFAGYLSRHCQERGLGGCSEAVLQLLNTIIVERLGLWIVANGGWEAFNRQFPAVCMFEPSSLWKAIGIIILLCGAAFAFYTSGQFINPGQL
jgi:hypothetical protein